MGNIYTFYSPRRGSGLTTLLVQIGEWLAAHTELSVALFDFTSRATNACTLAGNEMSLNAFLAGDEYRFDPMKPVAICDLKPDEEDSFKALRKAADSFDLVFVDLSNRLDQIGHQVLELSNRIILVAPGTELVVRYFHKMLELGRLLEKKETKRMDLLLHRVRHEDEVAILTEEIKTRMMGFVKDRPGEDDLKRVAENFYYDYYLQKLSDRRMEHFRQAIENFNRRLNVKEPGELAEQLWGAVHDLELTYNKRILLFRWLVFRSRLGQTFSQAAMELIPRFIAEDFNSLARDLAVETESLGSLVLVADKNRPA